MDAKLAKMSPEERLAAGYLYMGPIDDMPAQYIRWSPPQEAVAPLATADVPVQKKVSAAQEIMDAVQEYYRVQGKGVPPAEMKACLEIIKEEKKPKEPEPELPPPKPARPEYGTKEFWAAYWAKKRAAGHVTKKDAAAGVKK